MSNYVVKDKGAYKLFYVNSKCATFKITPMPQFKLLARQNTSLNIFNQQYFFNILQRATYASKEETDLLHEYLNTFIDENQPTIYATQINVDIKFEYVLNQQSVLLATGFITNNQFHFDMTYNISNELEQTYSDLLRDYLQCLKDNWKYKLPCKPYKRIWK